MGFVYPLVGLLCFFIPFCAPPQVQKQHSLEELAIESDAEY